ncbi:MAG: hypothetical protein AAGI01_13475 [Myxococcota bacterium]
MQAWLSASWWRVQYDQAWRGSPSLVILSWLMIPATLGCLVGLGVDDTMITGAPAWLKPLKFMISTWTYAATLAWITGFMDARSGWARRAQDAIAVSLAVELLIISYQASCGTISHYNRETVFDFALYMIMALGVTVISLAQLGLIVLAVRQRFEDPFVGSVVRSALVVSLVGMLLGGLMNMPKPDQLEKMERGEQVEVVGGHAYGVEDGGPGLPFVGWSTEGGDRRIGHFAGLHALQLLPLWGFGVARRVRTKRRQRALVRLGAGIYIGLLAVWIQQAQRAEPLFAPGSLTLGLLAALTAVAALAGVWLLSRK